MATDTQKADTRQTANNVKDESHAMVQSRGVVF